VLPAGMNIREGVRELERRGLVEVRVERPGRPSETWSLFVSEDP
jgi:predicted ArsR family transcriptional regulator